MRKVYSIIWVLGISTWVGVSSVAQDLTVKDGAEISYQAKTAVTELQDLFNFVTFADLPPNELKEVISNSYNPSKNQVFFNKDVIIEDDIDPAYGLGKTRDLDIEKYLNTLDVFYEKTIDATITFSNIKVSNIKKKDFIYIKVYFESQFGSKFKKTGESYASVKRVAQFRAEKAGSRWKTKIIGISFYNPDTPIESKDNDLALLSVPESDNLGASGNKGSNVASQKEIEEAVSKYMREREESDKKERESEYTQAIQRADLSYATEDYLASKDAYTAAADVYPFRTYPKIRLNEVNRIILTYFSYDELKKKGDLAKNYRDYESSIEYYRKALNAKPEMLSTLDPEIRKLSSFVQEVSVLKTEYEAKKFKQVIEHAEDLIKQKKKQKNIQEYPELYLLRGKSYLQTSDKKAVQKALDDLNEAVALDQNYLEARLARAELNESRKNDVIAAVTDYDIITKAIDPLNPTYHARKAELKERLSNIKGALEDYDKAIALAPKRGLYPYQKALVLIKMKDFPQAKEYLEKSIRVEPEFAKAYYQRGMLWMEVGKLKEAAIDFSKAEMLGLETTLMANIQGKAIRFYDDGMAAMNQNDLVKAQKALDNAVLLRPKFTTAWFAKGQLYEKQGHYQKAAEQYTYAIQADERYKEAYYARGMAYNQEDSYEKALNDFQTALDIEPTYIDGFKGRGYTYMWQGKYEEAKNDLTKAINLALPVFSQLQKDKKADKTRLEELKTQLAEAYSLLGYTRHLTGEDKAALDDIKKGMDYATLADAYRYRGLIYQKQGDHKKAISDFSEALKQNSRNQLAYHDRALSLAQTGKFDEALDDLSHLLKNDTQTIARKALLMRGKIYGQQGKYTEALKDMQSFTQKYPEAVNAEVLSETGKIYLEQNKGVESLKQFEKALLLDNTYPQAHYGMACAYAMQGQNTHALAWLETAFKTGKITKDQVKKDESKCLKPLLGDKESRRKFDSLKKNYLK